MAKTYFKINEKKFKKIEYRNGATRRTIVLVAPEKDWSEGLNIEKQPINLRVGWLDKGNHSFVFCNKSYKKSDSIIGIYMNDGEGEYFFPKEKVLYKAESHGGYGGRFSTLAVLKEGCYIEETTYKNRRPSTFYVLTKEGFKCLGDKTNIMMNNDEYSNELKNIKKWEEEIKFVE